MPSRYGPRSAAADCGVPFMVSEFGGIGWATTGGWGYGSGPKTLEEFYTRYQGLVDAQLDNPNLFGFCYTQLTDVEQEHNGLYYYDRRPKFDLKRLHDITARPAAYERSEATAPQPAGLANSNWKVLVGALPDGNLCKPYHYCVETPASGWNNGSFDDQSWQSGQSPFGHALGKPRTDWQTGDIYLRQIFNYDGAQLKAAAIVLCHDEDTEIFVNGQKVLGVTGFVASYEMVNVTEALRQALHKGDNTLAVHTHQTTGGQYIDLAVLAE